MSKKIETLKKRISETEDKRKKAYMDNLPRKRKSESVTCKLCGSKITSKYLKGYDCPVCEAYNFGGYYSFMSDSLKKQLQGYETKISDLKKQLEEEYQKTPKERPVISAFKRACNQVREELDDIYEEINAGNFIEFRGTTGGDVRCLRVYKDGRIGEK